MLKWKGCQSSDGTIFEISKYETNHDDKYIVKPDVQHSFIREKSTKSKMVGSVAQTQSRELSSVEVHQYIFRVTCIAVQHGN